MHCNAIIKKKNQCKDSINQKQVTLAKRKEATIAHSKKVTLTFNFYLKN